MPTRNRRKFLPRAIRAFQRQTHKNRELLIVADGEDVCDLIPADPRIRYIHADSNLTIGLKRNWCNEHARGDVIAHWDDDDWSHPDRLREQVAILLKGAEITGYHSALFVDEAKREVHRYHGNVDYALGSSQCYWRSYWGKQPFADVQVGEDLMFLTRARQRKTLQSVDGCNRLVASIHSGNTSPRQITRHPWTRLDWSDLPKDFQSHAKTVY